MPTDENLLRRYSQVFISRMGDVPLSEAPAALYAARRRQLLRKLDSFGAFAGMPRDPGMEEVFFSSWSRFVQDPSFLFLTGINQPGCFLLLDPLASDPDRREVLFVPPRDPGREFWFGLRIGYSEDLDEIRTLTGFKTILPSERFLEVLRETAEAHRNAVSWAYAFYWAYPQSQGETKRISGDHNDAFARELEPQLAAYGMELRSLAGMHMDLRVILDADRVAAARRAQEWTREAFVSLLPRIPEIPDERLLGLELDYRMQRQSDGDLAFPSIIAGGRNSCCLHYAKKDEPLRQGDLVLLDFGIRCGTQHSDISRTVPVSGRFDPLQRLLYEIVLDAQLFHEAQVKPGARLRELDERVWHFILEALEARFVGLGGVYSLEYEWRPHGVSHLIGEQIHEGDPFRLYAEEPLRPGMMISNEPGLYGHFQITLDGVAFDQWIGIRVEDDLLITENGCENLSCAIPRTVTDLEAAMRK